MISLDRAYDQFQKQVNDEELQKLLGLTGNGGAPEQTCLVEQFFKNEERKSPEQRSRVCMISCSCPRCRPICL